MATKRKYNEIKSKDDLDFLLNITERDITTSFIMECFGEFNGKTKFQPFDIISIPPGYYGSEKKKNKNQFITTVGLWIFNKYFIEPRLFNLLSYINKPLNSKMINNINTDLSYALLEDRIELEDLKDFIMKCQKFMPYSTILSPSHTLGLLLINKDIDKKKKDLLDKNKKAVLAGDTMVMDTIQKELLSYAKDLLKDDPSLDLYDSGARASFDNNFKNMYVMKGAVKDPDPNKGYNIITSSYITGVCKEEYSSLANSLSAGPYARAKKTQNGGYLEKLLLYSFQHMKTGPKDSDCGTTRHIVVDVDEDNIGDIMYDYAMIGNKLVEITSMNKDSFIGKRIKIRFSSMCESKDYVCNKCIGELLYKLGIENIGTAMPQLASRLKVLQLKKFHNDQIRFVEMDPMIAFGE